MSQSAAKRRATYADLEALPEHILGEIIDGVLYTFPRPRGRQGNAIRTFDRLLPPNPSQKPGSAWWILPEPGIELPRSPEVVPDLAGWRTERMAELPEEEAIKLVPDWVCEILSPSTRRHDLRVKRPFYARIGVPVLWYVDLDARTLTVSKLEKRRWVELGVWSDDARVRAEPFPEVEIDLRALWPRPR
jgi:Uma2 family endonuclease